LSGDLWWSAALGSTIAVEVLTLYLTALRRGWSEEEARALALTTLLMSQPFLVLATRSPDRPIWNSGRKTTKTTAVIVALLFVVPFAVVYFPPLASLLQLSPFEPATWFLVIGWR
jgi:magnesium-transporting ATPase (P-type)